MAIKESILRPIKRIRGGAELPHLKGTAECETVIMPPPETVTIPLVQHIGAPATPTVKKGDSVYVGTLIGEASGYISAPVHSSVSGTVSDVKDLNLNGGVVKCVIIESDGEMKKDPNIKPIKIKNKEDIVNAAKNCGLVGLGGAGFPTYVKLSPSDKTSIDTLIINGAECEPYITSDYRECIESGEDLMEAVYLLKEKLGVEKVIIGIEGNKPKAIEKLYAIAADKRDTDDSVKLMRLPEQYPQGAEKVIIYSATGRELPFGKLPSDVGCIVMNITSIATLYRYIKTGMPLVSKRITVEGDGINNPMNVIVPIGVAVKDVIEFAGGIKEGSFEIMYGGPMMGVPISNTDAVIEKRNNALLVLSKNKIPKTTACIRCGRCANTCTMGLYPAMVETAYQNNLIENYEKLNVNACMECGSCTYVCPAKRPLTQVMRVAKSELRRQKK